MDVKRGFVFVVLVPDSTNDRVMAFDAVTGALVNADFIPADPANLSTPKPAFDRSDGTGFLVVDQLDGTVVGVSSTAEIDGPRGVDELPSGNILVSRGSGVHEIARPGVFVDSRITGVSCHQINLATGVVPVELQSFTAE